MITGTTATVNAQRTMQLSNAVISSRISGLRSPNRATRVICVRGTYVSHTVWGGFRGSIADHQSRERARVLGKMRVPSSRASSLTLFPSSLSILHSLIAGTNLFGSLAFFCKPFQTWSTVRTGSMPGGLTRRVAAKEGIVL